MMEKTNDKKELMVDIDAGGLICPFVRKPLNGCYCASTSSLHTEATIYYCGGNFEKCDIYGKNARLLEA